MKLPLVIATAVGTLAVGVLLIGPANSQEDSGKAGTREVTSAKVKELQSERIAVLKEMAEVTDVLYRKARAEAGPVFEARRLLLTAEVELAQNDADRIKLYENFVAAMKEYEEFTTARKQAARGTEADVLKAKAVRLEAEIALEKVKSRAAS